MTDTVLSPGVKLAWQMAGDLALREQESAIRPRHILYGICSVEKMLNAEEKKRQGGAEDKQGRVEDSMLSVRPEVERLNELVAPYGLDLFGLRRALRALSNSAAINTHAIASTQRVHRSPEARQLFEAAASQSEGRRLELPCLFLAVLQADDPEIKSATINLKQKQLKAIRELSVRQGKREQFSISQSTGLGDLDAVPDGGGSLHIAESLDASIAFEPEAGSHAIERLAALSELTWECGTRGRLDAMLQKAIDQLLDVVGKGERGVILVSDSKEGELLMKAFGPPGAVPMISMTSAKRAIADQKGFIWKRGEDLTVSQKESNIESGLYVPLVV